MLEVSLRLLCTRKSGTLSRIIREINLLGLQYQSHQIKSGDEQTEFTIHAIGELNCTPASLVELFSGFTEVVSVQELRLTRDGKQVEQIKTTASETHISAQGRITPAVLLAAEKRLSQILGPVASFIVESNTSDSRNAGELFSRLADELNDQSERDYFLSIIENNK
jgi:hypothetical protein